MSPILFKSMYVYRHTPFLSNPEGYLPNSNSKHLHASYYVPGIVLSTLYMLTHFVPRAIIDTITTPILQMIKLRYREVKLTCPRSHITK